MTEDKRRANNKFTKREVLSLQKNIDRLFAKGSSFIAYPLRVVFYTEEVEKGSTNELPRILISVPKRRFKRANKRNRIKRVIREVYRLNKHQFLEEVQADTKRVDVSFLYVKDELPSYGEMEKAMKKALLTLCTKIKSGDEKNTN